MLIDVMVPAFGDDALVRHAIISVREQSDPRWRLTIIDDGPAAGRDAGLRQWLDLIDDRRIRYHANDECQGINRNFQRCVDASEADLVVLLGADDRLLPDFVSRVLTMSRRYPDAAFFHTGARIVDSEGSRVDPLVDKVKRITSIRATTGPREVGGEQLATSLLRGNWMYFPSVVFRRRWLVEHGFRPGYDVVQDLDLYLRILLAGGRVVLFDRPGIEYRRHAASVSSAAADDGSRFDEERRFFSRAVADMTEAGWPKAAAAARRHLTSRLHALQKIPGLALAGNRDTARTMLSNALSPLRPASALPEVVAVPSETWTLPPWPADLDESTGADPRRPSHPNHGAPAR
ncbi:glycosyltransferase family 2 protein [Pseudonocardia spinosispora]|uniref:glycosyltransferase family 2 protein n=1 Tax=Pseudonocardia spinosispora TaxID=103441 RepID=UPI0003F87D88|nr:glycosyltransferase [Pseudonocardia spinosispora]